jgi:3-oxoacyl-[acyl-carrier-protein] synthase III
MNEVFVSSLGHALGDEARTVEETTARGDTGSPAAQLRRAGFARHHVCGSSTSAYDLARRAVAAMSEPHGAIDTILYATCLPANAQLDEASARSAFARSRDVKHLMDFPASRLQAELDLGSATVIGIDQQACTGMLGALRVGAALLRSEPETTRILCVTADRFPAGALYEQAYNLISDGAAACVLSRQARGFRLLACHAIANGALARAGDDEVIGVYFTYTHRLISETLARARIGIADLDWIVPQNTNITGWTILSRLLGFERGRVYCDTLAEVGHVISADNLINLERLDSTGALRSGQRVLLAMAGYGMHWQAVLLQKC